jgi:hypothetical protein
LCILGCVDVAFDFCLGIRVDPGIRLREYLLLDGRRIRLNYNCGEVAAAVVVQTVNGFA